MDATQYGESDYVTAELVKASKTKIAIIIGEATEEDTDFGRKLTFPIEIDGKKKTYRPNKDSVKNIIWALGAETKLWLGKSIIFSVISVMGKDSVVAIAEKIAQKVLK